MGLFGSLLGTLLPGAGALSDVGATLAAFFGTITDGKMWRSLGWLVLGIMIMIFGLLLWLRHPIESAAGTAVKALAL